MNGEVAAVVVAAGGVVERSQDAHPVHEPRDSWEQLRDANTRDSGRDARKRPANFRWGVRLGVEGVQLCRPAAEKNEDHGRVGFACGRGRGGVCPENVWERQPTEAERSDLQKPPAIARRTEFNHRSPSFNTLASVGRVQPIYEVTGETVLKRHLGQDQRGHARQQEGLCR